MSQGRSVSSNTAAFGHLVAVIPLPGHCRGPLFELGRKLRLIAWWAHAHAQQPFSSTVSASWYHVSQYCHASLVATDIDLLMLHWYLYPISFLTVQVQASKDLKEYADLKAFAYALMSYNLLHVGDHPLQNDTPRTPATHASGPREGGSEVPQTFAATDETPLDQLRTPRRGSAYKATSYDPRFSLRPPGTPQSHRPPLSPLLRRLAVLAMPLVAPCSHPSSRFRSWNGVREDAEGR